MVCELVWKSSKSEMHFTLPKHSEIKNYSLKYSFSLGMHCLPYLGAGVVIEGLLLNLSSPNILCLSMKELKTKNGSLVWIVPIGRNECIIYACQTTLFKLPLWKR